MSAASLIPASPAFNMLGPYLLSEAECPFCHAQNSLAHIESYGSLTKPVETCAHLKAIVWDEDGGRSLEFASE